MVRARQAGQSTHGVLYGVLYDVLGTPRRPGSVLFVLEGFLLVRSHDLVEFRLYTVG